MPNVRPTLVQPGRQKFVVDAPLETHWRDASCEEVECQFWRAGFTSVLDTAQERHRDIIAWLDSGATGLQFVKVRKADTLMEIHFPPGQQCLESRLPYAKQGRPHRVRLDRLAHFSQQTASGVLRVFDRPEHMTECMNEERAQLERLTL